MFSHIYVVKNKQRAASFGVRTGPRVKHPTLPRGAGGSIKATTVTPLADSVIHQIQRQVYETAPAVSTDLPRPRDPGVGKGAG